MRLFRAKRGLSGSAHSQGHAATFQLIAVESATQCARPRLFLPAGDALRVGVTLTINGASSSGTVDETLYFVTVGRTTWGIIGVSVGDSERELFDQIAQTFAVSS